METIKSTIKNMTSSTVSQGKPEPSAETLKALRERYAAAKQDHVFAFYESLSSSDRGALYDQLSVIDPDYINTITNRALNPPATAQSGDASEQKLEPLPESATASVLDSDQTSLSAWREAGLDLVAAGKVAVLLLAGGQGTRLGSSAPKGCYDIGLPSTKSLFRLQAERIRKIQLLASARGGSTAAILPWYVMTSGPTREPTESFFRENKYFGLSSANVFFFEQGTLPCISNEGKIMLESKSRVAVAPDGNGGIYKALIVSGAIDDMRRRGIDHVHAYCVDNCLVRVADPVFLGFAASKKVDVATKVVRKRNATESVGLILLKNGKPDVVEYSEIDSATAEARDENHPGGDVLRFRAANIVNHYYSTAYLSTIPDWAHELPHHVARKKIPTIDLTSGDAIKPSKPNGIKLEQFIFDNFPRLALEKFASLEVRREDEFSPLKNAPNTGEDDPQTSKRDIMLQGKRWAEAAGAIVSGDQDAGIEVSPLVSYAGEGLEHLAGKEIIAPAVLEME